MSFVYYNQEATLSFSLGPKGCGILPHSSYGPDGLAEILCSCQVTLCTQYSQPTPWPWQRPPVIPSVPAPAGSPEHSFQDFM